MPLKPETIDAIRDTGVLAAKEVVDDILDVVEEVLSRYSVVGDILQTVIDDLREQFNIPDDIAGDED